MRCSGDLADPRHRFITGWLARIQLRDTPKIQVVDPTVDDHAIYFKEGDFRIPLSLLDSKDLLHFKMYV